MDRNVDYINQKQIYAPTPNKIFGDYYLKEDNTNYYNQIYSKKKMNLINDYMSDQNRQDEEQFVK